MEIVVDDLSGAAIADFLEQHMADMRATSPPESVHALDLDALRQPEITFWSVTCDGKLTGCGALKELDAKHAELKSMRTDAASRGQGIASGLLKHILQVAKARGYDRVSLETGPMDFFVPARRMYAKHGFEVCSPFGGYWDDPNSVFMTMRL